MKLKQWLICTALKFNLLTRKPKVEVLKLNKEDSLRLWEAIKNPPEPNEALQKAAKDYRDIFGFEDKK